MWLQSSQKFYFCISRLPWKRIWQPLSKLWYHNIEKKIFCQVYDLKHLIKEPTFYKIMKSLHVLTKLFPACPYDTGIPDFHKMTLTVLKMLKLLDTVITNHMITSSSKKSFIKNSHLHLQNIKPTVKSLKFLMQC